MRKHNAIPVGLAIVLACVAACLILVGLYFLWVLIALVGGGELDHDGLFLSLLAFGPLVGASWILWAVARKSPTEVNDVTEPPAIQSEIYRCPKCGEEIERGKQFCARCGAILYRNAGMKPAPWWVLLLLGILALAFGITGGCGLVFTILFLGDPSGFIIIPIVVAAVGLTITWLLVRLIIRLKRGE